MGANTGAHGPPDDLEPIGRFEWEQSLRMLAVPWPTKSFGLLLATYADKNGTNIHPGEDHLARVTGLTVRSVRMHLAALRETYCLLERTDRGSAGGRRAVADDYRLVMPNDVMIRIGLIPGEQAKRPAESPTGQQERLPIEPVDNPRITGSSFPVDNQDHRKLVSGDNSGTPETERTITGNLLHDHRKSSVGSPEADFRSPLREPIHDQNPDHASSPPEPNPRVAAPPVDKRPVDNSPAAGVSMSWAAIAGQARDAMAAAASGKPRHARATPPPIVRPDRE